MKTDTGRRIIDFIRENKKVRVHELVRKFSFSPVAIHKQLKRLIQTGELVKIGRPPHVYYVVNTPDQQSALSVVNAWKDKLDKNYLYISPLGNLIYGFDGFKQWLHDTGTKEEPVKLVTEYIKVRETANSSFNSFGWIDATVKIRQAFKKVYLEKLIYSDFYALPKFGKTKLGQLVLYAKQSQQRKLISEIVEISAPIIKRIITHYKIEAWGFIPPTVSRLVQFMKEFEEILKIKDPSLAQIPRISFKRVFGEVRIPQKSLPKLEQRIINARETIWVPDQKAYGRILLIDDAAGSGATFNETAKKLLEKKVVTGKIYAFCVVGSIKGFDVISEV